MCLYLGRMEDIGTATREWTAGCANGILCRSFTPSEPDTSHQKLARRFLKGHPEFSLDTPYYPVFKPPGEFIGGGYCRSITHYSARA